MDKDMFFAGNFVNCDFDYISADGESGVITGVHKGEAPARGCVRFPEECTILPGDFNAHSHPEQSLYVEIVSPQWDLAKWCRETIYKYSTEMTPERIYYACVRAFGRMLLSGVTSVMVSFYCHNRRGNELDRAVIRAARDVGIRLFFGRMNYDLISGEAYREKQDSQRSYYETPEEAARNFTALLDEECATVRVAPALHSFHANTPEGLERGINLGAEHGRCVQIHLSEDEGDVKIALENFGMRPVEVLAKLYKERRLSRLDHLVLSDCVWTDDKEKELITRHEMSVVLNGRMNERVKAGRADVKKFLRLDTKLYVGTDGEASNDDLSIKNERAWLTREHKLSAAEAENLSRPFEMAGMRVGALEPGAAADFQVYRNGKLDMLFVGGRRVMSGGKLEAEALLGESDRYIAEFWRGERRE